MGFIRTFVCEDVEFHEGLGKFIFLGTSPFGNHVRLTMGEILEFNSKSYDMVVTDAHLYYAGEEIKTTIDGHDLIVEVVRVIGDVVTFRHKYDGEDVIEDLILKWRESF